MNTAYFLALVFILQIGNGYGLISPSKAIYRDVNSTIQIVCTLDLNDLEREGLNSSYLSFITSDGRKVGQNGPNEKVQILNATSIELTIFNAQKQDLRYSCMLNNSYGVDMLRVYVGYEPKPVIDFKCVSYNWQNMKCTFLRSDVPSRVILSYKLDKKSPLTNQCATQGNYNLLYWSFLEMESSTCLYRQHYQFYYFNLTSVNGHGTLYQNFTIDNFRAVIPDPIQDKELVVNNITTNSAVVHYSIPSQLTTFPRKLTHLVNYTSEFSNGVWKNITFSKPIEKGLSNEVLLKHLEFANAWYDVRVSLQVENPLYDNMWSNFTSRTFRTLSRRPDEPPEIDTSGFSVDYSGNIYLYWKEIPLSKENGNNPAYNITIERGAPSSIRPNITTKTMAKFDQMTAHLHNDLVFHIRSTNDDGHSEKASVIVVPRNSRRLKHPSQIKKILHDRVYKLSWKAPTFTDDIESYTVFWCVTKNEFVNQCDGSINYERVSKYVTNFTYSSNETMNFAVATNSKVSSSGMLWAKCTAGSINDIGKLSTIWIAKIESTSIEFKWTLECVDQTIVNGFNLTYCPIKDPKTEDCKEGTERYINITKGDTFGYTLTDLTPYITYKTVISMYSSQRAAPGPPSEPLINTTLEAAPSPPRNLEYSNVTDTSVTLHWDIPEHMNGVLMKYKVWYNKSYKEVDKQNLSPNMTYILTGLKSFTRYDILVTASTVADSNGSNIVRIETKVGVPGNLTLPRVQGFDDELSIRWDPPETPNGKVQYYEVQVVNKMGDREEEYVSSNLILTRCTYNFKKCDVGVDTHEFRVRAVNVAHSPFERQRIDRPDVGIGPHVCKEADYNQDVTYVDQHATILQGNWSSPMQIYCNQSKYASGGWYVLWAFISMLGCVVASASFLMMKKFKKMKDIGVELPAGLEDIKEEANTKGLTFDCNISPRQENTKQNHYSTVPNEQEQSLLRNRMESGCSQGTDNSSGHCEYNEAIDDSESEQHNDDDSTAQTISESLDIAKSSPTPLIPISKLTQLPKIEPVIVPKMNPIVMPMTSSNYVSEEVLRSKAVPVAPVPTLPSNGYVSYDAVAMPSNGYTSWSAATSRPPVHSVEEPKVKTPMVATTDIQGISGYVTHKQLSDFGQLIQ